MTNIVFPPVFLFYKDLGLRVARNLAGYPFGTFITAEQRKEVECIAKSVFDRMEDDL
jgi:hypothetical protein